MKPGALVPLLGALLLAGVLAAYRNHFDNGFHFDDSHAVVNNAYIRSLKNVPRFFADGAAFSSLPANQTYRPVVLVTLASDYWLGKGLDPFWFHLSTFVLFLLQGILMYVLYRKVLNAAAPSPGVPYAAILAVAWYLLHPVHAETVNYISARSDLLSTCLLLLALALFACAGAVRRSGLYLVPAALAVLSKAQAAVFAPLLLAYLLCCEAPDNAAPGRVFTSCFRHTLPAFALCLLLLLFVHLMTPATWTPGGPSMCRYALTQPFVMLRYLRLFFLPADLSADTDWTAFASARDARALIGFAFLAALLATAVLLWRKPRTRPIGFGLLWFFIGLVPTSFVVPLAEVTNDHRVFLPNVGLALAAVWALWQAAPRLRRLLVLPPAAGRLLAGLAWLALLAACAQGTYRRNAVWDNDETLWHDVTLNSPANGRGLMNYGLARMAKGDYATAEAYFQRALKYAPQYASLRVNLAIVKAATRRPREAETDFRTALTLSPGDPECHFHYAHFLRKEGRTDAAVQRLEEVLRLSPAHREARALLMHIHHARGDYGDLARVAAQTLRLVPSDPQAGFYRRAAQAVLSDLAAAERKAAGDPTPGNHLQLSLLRYQAGRYRESIAAAAEALALKPDDDRAWNNICAACNRLELWDRAIEAGEKAVELNPANELAANNLVWARNRKQAAGSAE